MFHIYSTAYVNNRLSEVNSMVFHLTLLQLEFAALCILYLGLVGFVT